MADSTHVVCPDCNGVNRVPRARLVEGPRCGRCRAPLFRGSPVTLDAEGFERQVGRSDLPVLVDFWAPWCQPCHIMAPVLERMAEAREPWLRVAKLNTEEYREVAGRFGIRGIPTLILFRGGREVARIAGAMEARALAEWLDRYL
jgi:thioredoxin 2